MITPKKQLGQHWLEDKSVLKNIINYADLSIGEHVLEIGPGLGSLTRLLLDEMVNVTAVELDTNLANNLTKQVKDPNHLLEVINEDVLKLNLDILPTGAHTLCATSFWTSKTASSGGLFASLKTLNKLEVR